MVGFWPALLVRYHGFGEIHVQPGEIGRIGRDGMGALDGSVEFELALRDVALGAHAVVRLRTAGVVHAAREVDVIVAGAAGFSRGIGVVQVRLGRGLGIVAGFATPHVRGINHRREISCWRLGSACPC